MVMKAKILILLPTINEVDHIFRLYKKILFQKLNTDFLFNYSNVISDFSYDLSFGGNRMDQLAKTKQSQTVNLAQPGIFNLNNAASPVEIFQYESKKRINSLYGLVKLGYKDYLYLDITGRNDWSSALATPFSVIIHDISQGRVISKAGLITLGHCLARFGAPYNITCNNIAPGIISTEMTKDEIANVNSSEIFKKILKIHKNSEN